MGAVIRVPVDCRTPRRCASSRAMRNRIVARSANSRRASPSAVSRRLSATSSCGVRSVRSVRSVQSVMVPAPTATSIRRATTASSAATKRASVSALPCSLASTALRSRAAIAGSVPSTFGNAAARQCRRRSPARSGRAASTASISAAWPSMNATRSAVSSRHHWATISARRDASAVAASPRVHMRRSLSLTSSVAGDRARSARRRTMSTSDRPRSASSVSIDSAESCGPSGS